MNKKDNIFNNDSIKDFDFVFDKNVVSVFDDMINRSIPFYKEMQDLIVYFCDSILDNDFKLLDLGCSLGNTLFNIAEKSKKENFELIGIDSSIEMIEEANKRKSLLYPRKNINFFKSEINNALFLDFKNNDAIISSLTLQFIRPIERQSIVNNIFTSLNEDGIFILIEKTILNESSLNRFFIDRYYRFKKDNGYSETEIHKKRLSLENVLVPFSNNENISLLNNAGFKDVELFFQWLNFSCYIAKK